MTDNERMRLADRQERIDYYKQTGERLDPEALSIAELEGVLEAMRANGCTFPEAFERIRQSGADAAPPSVTPADPPRADAEFDINAPRNKDRFEAALNYQRQTGKSWDESVSYVKGRRLA
jgi:hypothetical protein